MNEENINVNELTISGTINSICESDFDKEYIKFGMTIKKYSKKEEKVYISLNVKSDLYNIYKDLFYKNNKIFVKGYLNSYTDKDNKIVTYVKVTELSNNPNDIIDGRKGPYTRYDEDGVMVWNGKRCEADPLSEDDPEYLEMAEMLKEYE